MLQVVVEVAGSVAEVLMYFYPFSFDYYLLLQNYIRYNNTCYHIYKEDRPALWRDGRRTRPTGLGLDAPAELCRQVLNHQGKQHQGRCQRNSWIKTARTKQFDNKDQTGEY